MLLQKANRLTNKKPCARGKYKGTLNLAYRPDAKLKPLEAR